MQDSTDKTADGNPSSTPVVHSQMDIEDPPHEEDRHVPCDPSLIQITADNNEVRMKYSSLPRN